ncbi:chromosome segregation protein SMC [Bacillus thuringiensis]|uniref:Chromosome segregation protein SMC n=1 Tax=Bacillus thuringiensis subsp. higo TaxID=132266 RepID=A0A9X6LBM1_BACUH|nr:chromosome segregation protein SMC [Bacillus thuringiensis]OUB42047.1 chromosome segregation protein SMC [Bacillus thuringiensis serovar higo]
MTENEKKLIQQIYEKVVSMEKKVDKLDGRLDSLEGKIDSLEGSFKGLQDTFMQGFADVHQGLNEIIAISKNRKSAREIVEGITGKE